MKVIPYVDLHTTSEDARIELIGMSAEDRVVGVFVDDENAKVERYKTKIAERFPKVRFIDQTAGPTTGVVTLRFGPVGN